MSQVRRKRGRKAKAMLPTELVHLKKNSWKLHWTTSTSISLGTPSCKRSWVKWKWIGQSCIQLNGCASCVFTLGPRLQGQQAPREGSSHGNGLRASWNTRELLKFQLTTCSVHIPLARASAMPRPKGKGQGHALHRNEAVAGVGVDAGRVQICNYTASSTLSYALFCLLHCIFHCLKWSNFMCVFPCVVFSFLFSFIQMLTEAPREAWIPHLPYDFFFDPWVI